MPRKWHLYSNSGIYRCFKFIDGCIEQEKRDYPVLDKVKRITGLSIELDRTDHSVELDLLNKAMLKREAIAYIGTGNAFKFAQEQRLPPLFELSELRWGSSQAQYYIAFDLNAFFLGSLNAVAQACVI